MPARKAEFRTLLWQQLAIVNSSTLVYGDIGRMGLRAEGLRTATLKGNNYGPQYFSMVQ